MNRFYRTIIIVLLSGLWMNPLIGQSVSDREKSELGKTGAPESELKALRSKVSDLEKMLLEQQKFFQQQMDEMKGQVAALQKAGGQSQNKQLEEKASIEISLPASAGGEKDKASADLLPQGRGGASGGLEAQLARELGLNSADSAIDSKMTDEVPDTALDWSPSQPMSIGSAGGSYMNFSLSALVDAGYSTASDPSEYLNLGDHDPAQRGFSMPNTELVLDGAVDPYFKGFASIVFKLEPDNSTAVELEEAFLQSTSLPWNLQLRGGQFFANFGRQNSQHPHTWAFVDQPLMLNRAFGPDGLRNPGAELSWLAPTPFFLNASLGIFNGQGGTAWNFRNPEETHGRPSLDFPLSSFADLLYVPRIASSFDIGETQTLNLGVSGAFGANNTGNGKRSSIGGADLYWKWKSPTAQQGFPFVSWQAEFLYSSFEAGADPLGDGGPLPNETLLDWGGYSQILWGVKPRWVLGMRGDWVDGNSGAYDSQDVFRNERLRISPNLTWYPSEFSKIRLQYNYDDLDLYGVDHSIWLQIEFLLGAHAAHKF